MSRLQPLGPAGARDHCNALLHQIAQRDLRGGLSVHLADTFEHFIARHAAARDRAIGDDRDAARLTGRDHFVLVEKRMAFDLIADHWLGRHLVGLFQQRHSEIRNADRARVALALHL